MSGYGAYAASPFTDVLHTNVQGPVAAIGKSDGALRSGFASATSVPGLIASGDASIQAAARNGGITEIHWVDYHAESTLGIFAKYTVTVYGTGNTTPTTNDPLRFHQDSRRGRQFHSTESGKSGPSDDEKILAIIIVTNGASIIYGS